MAFRATNDMAELIDGKATSGLAGVSNSLAYRVHEIEKHFHSPERWFGISADQSGTDWALAATLNPFVVTSGDDTWGGEAKLLGTSDTPAIGSNVRYDLHRFIVSTVSVDTIWKLQFIYGSSDAATALSAGDYTEIYVGYDSANPNTLPRQPWTIQMPRATCGTTKMWCRGWNATNLATISLYIGLHEYPG